MFAPNMLTASLILHSWWQPCVACNWHHMGWLRSNQNRCTVPSWHTKPPCFTCRTFYTTHHVCILCMHHSRPTRPPTGPLKGCQEAARHQLA